MAMNSSVVAVILGGGRGTRLNPLTKHRSKPAVPIAGKYRLVDIPISNCLNSDIRKIFVLTQFNSASLNRHIKETYNFDVFSSGFVDILAAEQTPANDGWYRGTADAVRQSLQHLKNHHYQYVLVLSGDQLYQMNYKKMLKQHKENKAELSVATIPVNDNDATGFGIMKTNSNDRIVDFIEKPNSIELNNWKSETSSKLKLDGKEYLASMGIYIFNKDALDRLLEETPEGTDFGKEYIPNEINDGGNVFSYKYEGYWTDIGTIRSFYEASLALTSPLPEFNLYDNNHYIYTRGRSLPASKMEGTTTERSIIAEGCIISASRIVQSVVGTRARIGKGTTIEDSILMGNDYFPTIDELQNSSPEKPSPGIGDHCYISNAIIDKNCRIGHNVRIMGGHHLEDGDYNRHVVVDGIVIIPSRQIIPNGYRI